MVGNTEVAELEGEADEVGDEVGSVDAAIDEDGAVDVGMVGWGIDSGLVERLGPEESEVGDRGSLPRGGRVGHRCSL